MTQLTPSKLKKLYENGHNISAILRKQSGLSKNTEEIIELAYDLQTGSYISAMEIDEQRKSKQIYCAEIAKTIQNIMVMIKLFWKQELVKQLHCLGY